ncbi:hypothetical protein [Microbacterium luteum]|uniref:hypothetical protein n=1 Tax=Microbacterium luteum TaxID=2782167 RepID=UPI0018888639|nr:hypothetical protein [Microbacterium luteum]
MTKQLVNLIGAATTLAILVLAVLVFALPLFTQATRTAGEAGAVAAQNRSQQGVLDALVAQSADMTALEAQVATLRAEIPAEARVDDVLLLAIDAAAAQGGSVTSVTPASSEAFAVRTDEAATPAPQPADEAAETDDASAAVGPSTTLESSTPAPVAASDGPQQTSVTVVVAAPTVEAATRILDELRAGPRLVAVTQASVTEGAEGGASLSATLLVFTRP